MHKEDYEHLAQVGLSLKGALSEEEFDRYIDRMLWAIHASPKHVDKFDEDRFRKRCHGEQV